MSNPYGSPPPFPNQPVPAPYQQVPTGPRGLATASIWLAIALTAVVVITAAVSYPVSVAVNDTMLSATPSTSTLIWVGASVALGLALFAVLISLYIVGCLWLLRSYDFARVVNPTFHMRRSRAWVWLGWWVPIVSLWFPLQVVDDVRRATANNQPRPSLAIWWTAWLVAILSTNLSGKIFNSEDVLSRDAIIIVAMIDALSAIALVIACVSWISIIRGITRDQEAARG
ncbi:DUF4328 domain-containing protein [Nocardioides sp. NPDC051685]|uniref:DUF4328 domain-containing protein n=1 Tax=Nocardioides sp. NPDC051685 TaxID=3364334 RepID=UPI00378A5E01